MNRTLVFSLTFILLFATKGKCDKFIYNGDTISINSKSLLDKYPGIKSLKAKLPACYRVEWAIVNNELLLSNIYACATAKSHLKALDLKSLFRTNDARIVAKWVTDTLWLPTGKPKAYEGPVTSIHDSELRIILKDGGVGSKMEFTYHNPPGKFYIYDRDARNKFIYSHINWKILPHPEGRDVKINLIVETGPNGKIKSIQQVYMSIIRAYNDEALRVVNVLPLGVYYKSGKVITNKEFVSIEFTEENRKKYAQ